MSSTSLLDFLMTVDGKRESEFVAKAVAMMAQVEITDATHLSGAIVAEWVFEHKVVTF